MYEKEKNKQKNTMHSPQNLLYNWEKDTKIGPTDNGHKKYKRVNAPL